MAGCTNHNCYIDPPKGMGTNGMCSCLKPLGKENELALKKKLVMSRRDAAQECSDLLSELKLCVETVVYIKRAIADKFNLPKAG